MAGAVWILIDSRLGMEEIKMNQTYVTLNDGNKIPQFGLGVYMIPGDENTKAACMEAFRAGYRHIDTAHAYQNDVICCKL